MYDRRIDIRARLVVRSPLHVGTGESRDDIAGMRVEQPRGEPEKRPRVATVVRDVDGLPCLPGTTVKGILLRLMPTAARPGLFGTSNDTTGTMGRLLCAPARLIDGSAPPAGACDLPHYDGKGVFVAARTAIRRKTGTVDEHKLFHQEMVVPGCAFGLTLRLLDPDDAALDALARGLALLGAGDGVAFGRGQSLGQGRLRLEMERGFTVEDWRLDDQGDIVRNADLTGWLRDRVKDAAPEPTPAEIKAPEVAASWRLTLTGEGPFLTVGEARRKPRPGDDERCIDPHLKPLQEAADKPLLNGSGLTGVLRARADWLAALAALRTGETAPEDNRWRVLAGRNTITRKDAAGRAAVPSPALLTPVECLFGVAGWRGLVELGPVTLENRPPTLDLTSVKLDRFSGAPIDGGLFTTRAHLDPVFTVTLSVRRRHVGRDGDDPGEFPTPDGLKLVRGLIADLERNGLTLGHGGNKGYGWFRVTAEPSEALGGTDA